MRSCIQFQIDGQWLRGTCHEPPGASRVPEPGRTALLFSNSGWFPRSGPGDLAVHWADAFAQDGYRTFRFDMPGLGDSDGDVPTEPWPLLNMIQRGDHAPYIHSLAGELKKRYGLERIILGGHCGSAMTAVYATLLDKSGMVAGLILMDMIFEAAPSAAPANGPAGQMTSPLGKARRLARRLILNVPGGGKVQKLYHQSIRVRERLQKMEIPANSNAKLMEAWRRVMDRRLPTIVIAARHPAVQPKFDYLAYLKTDRQPSITSVTIEGTTHSFLEGNGGEAVRTHCGHWLRKHFPAQSLAGNKKD